MEEEEEEVTLETSWRSNSTARWGGRRATQILLFECSASSERNRGGGGKQPIDLLTHEVDNFTVFKAKSNEICCF